jgi:hypothetical protein
MPPARKLNAEANRPGEFSILPERGARGFKVRANHEKYDVWQKDISANLPTSWVDPEDGQTKPIRWIANFGLKLKGKRDKDPFEDRVEAYTIEFDEVEGSKYVYFDGKSVQPFKDARHENGKVIATLDLGDPNGGMTP